MIVYHLIYFQLGSLGLEEETQGVHKLDGSPHSVWCCCRYSRADSKTSVPIEDFWGRERFTGFSIFVAARKDGSGWIGLVILIGWKFSATLRVKLNNVPNKNIRFFLLQFRLTELKLSMNFFTSLVWPLFGKELFRAFSGRLFSVYSLVRCLTVASWKQFLSKKSFPSATASSIHPFGIW